MIWVSISDECPWEVSAIGLRNTLWAWLKFSKSQNSMEDFVLIKPDSHSPYRMTNIEYLEFWVHLFRFYVMLMNLSYGVYGFCI